MKPKILGLGPGPVWTASATVLAEGAARVASVLNTYFLQHISKVGYGAHIISFERKGAQCYS